MYITRIEIKDIRCCDFTFNLEKKRSVLLCGDNGDGKSTILRSIAMGLCDETSAAGLLRELQGDFVRKGKDEAHIELELRDRKGVSYKIRTEIKSLDAFERLEQKVYVDGKKKSQDDFPWQKIFVSAYGPGNRISGIADYQHYVPVDAVYHLFKNDLPLQNPELVIRRIIDDIYRKYKKDPEKAKQYSDEIYEYLRDLLKTLLNLDARDQVKLTRTGIKVKSRRWKEEAELGSLGDGYRSTVTWIMDLLSWWMLYMDNVVFTKKRKIPGIVLIDELEQHLHPKWQIQIMQLLLNSFQNIQFIATTHSPLVISGSKDVDVIFIEKGKPVEKTVHGWLSEDVYKAMGLDTSRAPDTKIKIKQYEDYHLKKLKGKLSSADKTKMNKLKKDLLSQLPSDDPIVLTSELENLSKELLKR